MPHWLPLGVAEYVIMQISVKSHPNFIYFILLREKKRVEGGAEV